MVFVLQNPKVKPERFEKLKNDSYNFNEFTVLYNGYSKKTIFVFECFFGVP
jgi:hypothetical protein